MKTGPIVHMPAICFGRQICANFIFILFILLLKSSMSKFLLKLYGISVRTGLLLQQKKAYIPILITIQFRTIVYNLSNELGTAQKN